MRGTRQGLQAPLIQPLNRTSQSRDFGEPVPQVFQLVGPRVDRILLQRPQPLQEEMPGRVKLELAGDEKRLPVIFLVGLQNDGLAAILKPFCRH